MKPNYLQTIEQGFVFSQIEFIEPLKIYDFWKTKKVSKVYENSFVSNDSIFIKEVLYKTAQDFYIHLQNKSHDEFLMTIYYKIEQENELKLFIKNLFKQIQNATN